MPSNSVSICMQKAQDIPPSNQHPSDPTRGMQSPFGKHEMLQPSLVNQGLWIGLGMTLFPPTK